MNRLPASSPVPPFVPLRRRRRRRTHVVSDPLLLAAGVGLAFVVSAVVLLQDAQRKLRQDPVRESVAPAVPADKADDVVAGLPWSVDGPIGPSRGEDGKLHTDVRERLLHRVSEATRTVPR